MPKYKIELTYTVKLDAEKEFPDDETAIEFLNEVSYLEHYRDELTERLKSLEGLKKAKITGVNWEVFAMPEQEKQNIIH